MKKFLIVTALLASGGLAMAEEPQGVQPAIPGDRPIDRFPQLDADSDGRLSRDEVGGDALLSEQFSALDKDRNGYINRDEFPRSNAAPARELEEFDFYDDQQVLPSREPAFPAPQFKPLIRC